MSDSIVTEYWLSQNFTPKSGVTPGSDNLQAMDCDQVAARYLVSISGITTTGNRLPSQQEVSALLLATVTTGSVSNITSSDADVSGNVTNEGGSSVTSRGICWNTTGTPTLADAFGGSGSGLGSFTVDVFPLSAGTTYYVRAYATNSAGTAYGNQVSFTTLSSITVPTVTTSPISRIEELFVEGGGNVTNNGGSAVTARGVCWDTSSNPTILDSKTNDGSGTGTFNSLISPLSSGTTYYIRAYATNSVGTSYGSEISVTTKESCPSVGDTYQGGIVVHIFQPGECGYVSGECHGLIVAPSSSITTTSWATVTDIYTGATYDSLCSGDNNTAAILGAYGTAAFASRYCDLYSNDGYYDWFLPSREQMQELNNIGPIFPEGEYWTSIEYSAQYADCIINISGSWNAFVSRSKTDNKKVLPFRKF